MVDLQITMHQGVVLRKLIMHKRGIEISKLIDASSVWLLNPKPAKPINFHQLLSRIIPHQFPQEQNPTLFSVLRHQHHLNDQEHQAVVVHLTPVSQQQLYLLRIAQIILLMILQL
jgi:hypothetical protein